MKRESLLTTAAARNKRGKLSTPTGSLALAALAAAFLMALAPGLQAQPALELFNFTNLNRTIPDGTFVGLSDSRSITSAITSVSSVRVKLHVTGQFNGDLYCYVRHVDSTRTNLCVLINRPGRSSTNALGYADAGMDVTFDDAAANGDIHFYRNVTTPAAGSPLAGTWQPDGRKVDPMTVTEASPRSTTMATLAGGSGSGTWSLYVVDADSGGTNVLSGWELELRGSSNPVISWTTPADIVYGTALGGGQLNATSAVAGTYTYSPPAGTILNAGTGQLLTVTFSPADTNQYLAVTTNVLVNVLKKSLTVAANDTNKVYGAPLPAFSAAYSGFVNGDTTAKLSSAASLASAATASSPAGTYAITASGVTASNYNITYVSGTLTINRAGTAATLASSANPALPGAPVTFTCSISIVPAGAGVVDGAVQFKIDASNAGAPILVTNGTAVLVTTLPLGTHSVTADYLGSANLTASSATLSAGEVINTPPIAGADTIDRWPTNGTKVAIATLLANDTDADGDPITFVSCASTSANGAALAISNGWIIYQSATGFTNTDTFTYTITDGRGASVSGTVTVALKTAGASSNLAVTDLGNGSYRIHLDGVPGQSYRLQYTSDLSSPAWQDLTSGTANDGGMFEYIDSTGTGVGRFYRAVSP